jgi:hypothetical protein
MAITAPRTAKKTRDIKTVLENSPDNETARKRIIAGLQPNAVAKVGVLASCQS